MDFRDVLCFLAFCLFDSLFVNLILLQWGLKMAFPSLSSKRPKMNQDYVTRKITLFSLLKTAIAFC